MMDSNLKTKKKKETGDNVTNNSIEAKFNK